MKLFPKYFLWYNFNIKDIDNFILEARCLNALQSQIKSHLGDGHQHQGADRVNCQVAQWQDR